jgi:hypothetical protein
MFEGFFDLAGFPKDSTSIGTWDIKKYFGVTLPNMIYNNDKKMDLIKITQTANVRTGSADAVLKNDWKKGVGNIGETLAAKQAACESVGNGDQFDHLSSLSATEDKNARIRCGWTYNNSKPHNGRGAFGNSEGPFKPNAQGVWMWNLDAAKEKYHGSICSNIKDCPDIDSNMYKHRCGWCTKSGKAVPIVNNGTAYPYNTNTACPASQLITQGSKCPPPEPLDDPTGPRAPGEVCTPLQNGSLPRDCLIAKVTAAGCSDQGTLAQALRSGSDNDYSNVLRQQQAYKVFQERASMPLDTNGLKTGKMTISDALNNFSRVQDISASEANGGLQFAARDLCIKRGTIDEYDFCVELNDNTTGPFTLDCLQKAFLRGGGQKAGTAYPSGPTAAQWNGLGNWAAVKANIQKIYAKTRSQDRTIQEQGMMEFYGIRLLNKKHALPYGPEIAWKDTSVVLSCQRPLPVPESYIYAGCIDDENDESFDKWMKDWGTKNGWTMGTPPPPPYKTIDRYDFPGNDIKCEFVGDHPFGSEASFGKPRRECDADPNCVSHNEFQVDGRVHYCLKHNSSNGHSMAENAWWNQGNKWIRIHMKNPRQCKPPFSNPPEEVSGWKYKGCWKDCSQGRGLPNYLGQVSNIEQCIAKAKAAGYNTSGNQYFGECWAGNNTDWNKMGDPGCCEAIGGACTQQIYSSQ